MTKPVLYPKRWYGHVYRQTQGRVEPVLSTILESNLNVVSVNGNGSTPAPIQRLRESDIAELVAAAEWHADQFRKKFVEFQFASWQLKIIEVSPMEELSSARTIETINLQ